MTIGQDPGKVERFYDAISLEYSRKFAGEHEKKPMDQEVLGRFARRVGEGKPVLDLGCGPGETARYLRNLGIEVSGLDLSEKILEQARTRNPEISFRKGNILDLEFEKNSVAGAVAFYAMVHFTRDQVTEAVDGLYRILKPGGILLMTYHIGDETLRIDEFLGIEVDVEFMLFPTGFIAGCLAGAGFESVEILEREPYPEIEYESRRGYAFALKPLELERHPGQTPGS